MKGLRVATIVNEIMFQGVFGKLEAKICFQKQSFTKYLRQTLVLLYEIAKYGKVFISIFQQFFASINKLFLRYKPRWHWFNNIYNQCLIMLNNQGARLHVYKTIKYLIFNSKTHKPFTFFRLYNLKLVLEV